MKMLYMGMALLAGMFLPLQTGVNMRLSGVVGGTFPAAFVSFLVGTIGLAGALVATRQAAPHWSAVAAAPWWVWTGGFMGAYFVASVIVIGPRLGAGTMAALVVGGQVLASLVFDHYGFLGFPQIDLDAKRLLGAALLVAGVALIRA